MRKLNGIKPSKKIAKQIYFLLREYMDNGGRYESRCDDLEGFFNYLKWVIGVKRTDDD